jgi:hypothetical protein
MHVEANRKESNVNRTLIVALAAALAALVAATTGTAYADRTAGYVQRISAHLNADQQVPSPDGAPTGARGTFSATYNSRTRILTWRLSWVRVSEPTTEAAIHYGRTGLTGRTALTLCKPCQSPASGHSKLVPGLAHAILQPQGGGLAYVTIDTQRNPQGEIRGEVAELCPC